MRLLGRLIVSLLSILVLAGAVYTGAMALRWVDSRDGFGMLDRRPEQPLALSSLNAHTREAASKASFRRYFTTMVLPEPDGSPDEPVVVKWEHPHVTIKLLNSVGPEIDEYLRRLVARLNRMQGEVRFTIGDDDPRITIRFLDHEDYVRQMGGGSVGTTRTRFFRTSPGLIRARIAIDAGRQRDDAQLKATLIHELTHAIGAGGHFTELADRRRSVLYQSSHLTAWSQNDAAVIRLLYSERIRSGMTEEQVHAALRRYARAAATD
jgi:hypothetical protein